VASFVYFAYFFSTHTLEEDEALGGLTTGGACFGDLPFHLNVINSFRHGANHRFWLWNIRNPLYLGNHLSYPIVSDFHSAALSVAGFSVKDGIVFPAVLLSISFLPLLYLFGLKMLGGGIGAGTSSSSSSSGGGGGGSSGSSGGNSGNVCARASLLSVFLTVFSGGIGFVSFVLEDKLSWKAFLEGDFVQRTTSGQDLFWMNLTSNVLIPQRAALYGYPLFLAIVLMLHTAYQATTLPIGTPLPPASSFNTNSPLQTVLFSNVITKIERKKLLGIAGKSHSALSFFLLLLLLLLIIIIIIIRLFGVWFGRCYYYVSLFSL